MQREELYCCTKWEWVYNADGIIVRCATCGRKSSSATTSQREKELRWNFKEITSPRVPTQACGNLRCWLRSFRTGRRGMRPEVRHIARQAVYHTRWEAFTTGANPPNLLLASVRLHPWFYYWLYRCAIHHWAQRSLHHCRAKDRGKTKKNWSFRVSFLSHLPLRWTDGWADSLTGWWMV